MDSYVVLAHTVGNDPDITEWSVFDGTHASESAYAYAARLRDVRGFRNVMIRPVGAIEGRLQ